MYFKIKNGYFDDVLNSQDSEKWIQNYFPMFNKVCEIDKDLAFKYGYYYLDDNTVDLYDYNPLMSNWDNGLNTNVHDLTRNGEKTLHDKYWKERESWFNDNGKLKKHRQEKLKNYLDTLWQDNKWSEMADSRPLHRKGSLNRD